MLAGQLANRGLIHYMGVAFNAVQGMCAKMYVYKEHSVFHPRPAMPKEICGPDRQWPQ
jgi:hypothetical protein